MAPLGMKIVMIVEHGECLSGKMGQMIMGLIHVQLKLLAIMGDIHRVALVKYVTFLNVEDGVTSKFEYLYDDYSIMDFI